MNIEFIQSGEKKEVLRRIENTYGIENLKYLLLRLGKEKIRGFSGHMIKEEIREVSKLANIEGIGLYLIKKGEGLRMSFDATQILKPLIKKTIFKLNDKQFKEWISGQDLEVDAPRGILVMEHDGDYYGCGKSSGVKIFNQTPKERRVKL